MPRPLTRHRRALVTAGAVGLAAAGILGGGALAANAANGTPSPSPSASAGPQHGYGPGQRMHAPHIGGTVLSVDGSTVKVKDRDGFTRTIALAANVTVTKNGAASTRSAITTGAWVRAFGTVAGDRTTLNATTVAIGDRMGPNGDGRGWGGPRGRGGWGPGAGSGAPTPSQAPSDGPTQGS